MTSTEAASQLDTARTQVITAQADVDAAVARFDRTGDDTDLAALQTARTSLAAAGERVARAERLLAAAKRAEDEAAKRAKDAEAEELGRELSRENVATLVEPLQARLREQIFAVAETLDEICGVRRGLERKETRLNSLRGTMTTSSSSTVPKISPRVDEVLDEARRAADVVGTTRQRIFEAMASAWRHLSPYAG